jgi:hypothetical protein
MRTLRESLGTGLVLGVLLALAPTAGATVLINQTDSPGTAAPFSMDDDNGDSLDTQAATTSLCHRERVGRSHPYSFSVKRTACSRRV